MFLLSIKKGQNVQNILGKNQKNLLEKLPKDAEEFLLYNFYDREYAQVIEASNILLSHTWDEILEADTMHIVKGKSQSVLGELVSKIVRIG